MSRLAKSSLLLFFFSLCAAAIVVTHDLQQRQPPPPPRELYSIVNSQLTAFRHADFRGAYLHASSGVQQKFSPLEFEKMVRRNYGAMTRSQRVEFGLVRVEGPAAVVQVFFIGADGSEQGFLYSLVAEDGAWKIAGVEPMPVSPLPRSPGGLQV
jgi:Domain of unknown function (DUF4864)